MNVKCKTQICRLCLAQTATCFSLTENNETSSMLEALTALRISPSDDISTIMCLKCRLNLKLAFSIQQNMLRAEQRFRERLLCSIKQEKEECDLEDSTNFANPDTPADSTQVDEFTNCADLKDPQVRPKRGKYRKNDPSLLEPHTCDICGRVRPSWRSLQKHKYESHVKRKCPICGKEVTSSNLSHHVQRHTMRRAICEICGEDVRKEDLRVHVVNKHRDPKHKCEFCGKLFRQKARKITHEKREHLNEASYVCDTCGKKFYQDRDLKKHIESTHLKLRPFICEFCKVGFSSRFSLRTHRRQHTNETPYKCEVCGDGFRQKVSLKAHLKSKHQVEEELTTECTVCGKKFASKVALYSHSRIH